MTIEVLKAETAKLSKLEKLEFLQFLAEALSQDERAMALTPEQERALIRRREDVKSSKVQTIPATKVKAKLAKKYGLQA
ncbi:MAG: addiction module protein [Lewinellaceae bacterium]|nr:addiction module protein [Lewinellaceae bacterium]